MSLEALFSQRTFESPYGKVREVVGPSSALWSLLLGPLYFWRKRAPVEGLVYFLLTVPMVGLADVAEAAGLPDSIDLGIVLWVGFALAAPALLAASYLRKGWVEISERELGSGANFTEASDEDRYDAAIRRHLQNTARR
ncbi:MAG TPA: hypothetical protein VEC75_10810 [Stellaceae bacterium]|nr:hypothetical protein [Stellaceae bacterium]HYC14733.1 hypothetical protein [Stellaceae bacterium]